MTDTNVKTKAFHEDAVNRYVYLYLNSRLVSLAGPWDWDLRSDALFCSDVIMNSIEVGSLPGTQCILYPDDKAIVLAELSKAEKKNNCSFHFRIITTYGEVKWLKCQGYLELKENQDLIRGFRQNEMIRFINEKQMDEKCGSYELQLKAYTYAEPTLATGIWYMNTSTMEIFYSDQVYRIFGLPPQSLNAHYHTFTSFIHPLDKGIVSETFDRAFRDQIPLDLEYRILLKDNSVRYVSHITRWFRNAQGELVLAGVIRDNSEKKVIEQEILQLKDEVKMKDEILNLRDTSINIGNWYINLVTRKIVYSDSVYRIYGIKQKSDMGGIGYMSSSIHPDDKNKMEEVMNKVYSDFTPPDVEFRIIRKDGKTRYLHQTGKLTINSQQEMVMVGIIEDITERVVAHKNLAEYKARFQVQGFSHSQAEEMAALGSWMWDVKTGEITWSDGFYQLLGKKAASIQLTQKSLLHFVHPEDRTLFTDYISSVITQGQNSNFDFRIIRNGELRYVKAIFKLIQTDARMMFIGIVQDITAEKLLQKQLADQVLLSDLVSDAIVDRVFVTDNNHYIIKWNKACEEGYGIEKSKAIGRNLFDVIPLLKTPEVLQFYQKVLNGETITIKERRDLLRNAYIDLQLVPIKDDNMATIASLCIIHDVTKEYELRMQLTERLMFIEKLLAASIDRVIVMDEYMNYIYWNDKAEQYYGLPKERVLGKNVLEIFPGFINDPFYMEFRKALRGQTVHIPPKESDGNYYEAYLIPLKNEAQKVTGILWVVHDLSTEYHLGLQEQKATEILDVLNENYFELDRNFRFLHINHKSEEYFRFKNDDLSGKLIWDVFPEMQGTAVQKAIISVLQNNQPVAGEYIFPVHNHWVYLSMAVTKDGVMGVFIDIQDLKKAEEEIKENQHFIQQIADSTPDVITVFDLENNTGVYMNHTIGTMLGYDVEELTAMGHEGRLDKVIYLEDRGKLLKFNESLKDASDLEIKTIEYRVVNKDGTLRWIKNRGKPFKRSKDGEVTHVISILQDISDEMMLRQKLEERTKFIETLIDANLDRIIVFDKELRLLEWNRRCEDLYKISRGEALGKPLVDVLPLVNGDPLFMQGVEKAFSGSYVHMQAKKDLYFNRFNESYFIPLLNEQKQVYAVLNILHDVTGIYHAREKLKELNNSLEQKNRLLEQKNDEITTFAFVASHDLKEPLRKIYTFSDWLAMNENENLSSSGKGYIQKLTAAVRVMESLIEDILALTKIHAEAKLEARTDLNVVLKNVEVDMRYELLKKGAIIDAVKLPEITANPNQLFYLFKNIISNAIKFQRPGNTPRITITFEWVTVTNSEAEQGEKTYLKLSFADNGIGMDMKYSKKIFQVFQRLHTKVEFEGTGMGLAICKKVMENHDGFITLESEENKGTVFHCFFPVP